MSLVVLLAGFSGSSSLGLLSSSLFTVSVLLLASGMTYPSDLKSSDSFVVIATGSDSCACSSVVSVSLILKVDSRLLALLDLQVVAESVFERADDARTAL